MKLITCILFLMITNCYADNTDTAMHVAAHFGGTYAITDVVAATCTAIKGKGHKLACTLTGVIVSQALNVAYKAHEGFPNDTKRALMAGSAGSASSALVITLFW